MLHKPALVAFASAQPQIESLGMAKGRLARPRAIAYVKPQSLVVDAVATSIGHVQQDGWRIPNCELGLVNEASAQCRPVSPDSTIITLPSHRMAA
eukprot:740395-Prymnesium_polylepis.2